MNVILPYFEVILNEVSHGLEVGVCVCKSALNEKVDHEFVYVVELRCKRESCLI